MRKDCSVSWPITPASLPDLSFLTDHLLVPLTLFVSFILRPSALRRFAFHLSVPSHRCCAVSYVNPPLSLRLVLFLFFSLSLVLLDYILILVVDLTRLGTSHT
ncbi:hypothetical protein BO86DRAFT_43824 [Aspergillus japonicus CBS 114.51]|uniref:Uncharacterized protein n=1 Tax=Aspergillus japonicus CBS 114.51 TaxID=1448312 RepID=A0A8T8X638_ASPJA|nr:hypothetical protein BO86DRAFT_43824 [Aspergillus japonicus CBS 114.51]RAH83618.1 hypothetical protein BO86DRAFT_43824 [Aspergillus japonicus CBS 114.51]